MSTESRDCRAVQQELAASRGQPDALTEEAAVNHLEGCAECRRYAADCRALSEAGAALQATFPQRSEERILQLARRGRDRAREPRSFWWSLPRWALPALSASLSAAAAILVLGLSTPSSTPTARPVGSQRTGIATRPGGGSRSVGYPADLAVIRSRALLWAPQPGGAGATRPAPSGKRAGVPDKENGR
jgi:hypothetical protein